MNTKLWKCADGSKVRIKDMADSHLINAAAMLERKHAEALDVSPPCFGGEMAQYYADQEYDALLSSDVGDMYPIYDDMQAEIERRGLRPNV